MNNLVFAAAYIPTMSDESINKVRQFEGIALSLPQIELDTDHLIHAGMYARTILIPAGAMITGALIKIATTLIVSGTAVAYIGDGSVRLTGYNVIPASSGRKQAFLAETDTYLTMIFPTDATSIAAAEDEFTDEADMLISRRMDEI